MLLHTGLVLKLHVRESHYSNGEVGRANTELACKAFCSIIILLTRKCMHCKNIKALLLNLQEIKEVHKKTSGCQKIWMIVELLNTIAQTDDYNVLRKKQYFRLGGRGSIKLY